MCGIAGFLSQQFNSDHLKKMTDTLQHRGPDAEGHFFNKNKGIGLGHRRLSILDLTSDANQPFYSRCGNFVMVFNGEIYNFKAIANELKRVANYEPKTTSDTEIIIEAYAFWGSNFIDKLNGMFAIAIWDKKEEKITLFRDRVGIKPLYYFWKDGVFAFASEMKSLLKLFDKKDLTIDVNTVHNFLHLGYTTGEFSIFQEIKKVPNGSSLQITKCKELKINTYWSFASQIQREVISDESVAKEGLKNRLVTSVENRMLADVPLGTFLSGGIDSSLITAISQDLSLKPINTFSIGFKDNKFDESVYSKKIAKKLGTNHHEFILTEQDAIEQVDNLTTIYDEPFGDSSAIPTLLVSQMAKKHVTVALSGDGGDEQFLGYGMYQWANRMNNPLLYSFRKPIAKGLQVLGNNRLKRGAMVVNAPKKSKLKSHIFSQEQYLFSSNELQKLLIKPIAGHTILEHWKLNRTLNPMEEQAFFDLHNYLKDDLLVKVDRASMFHSLEVRVPLLDHNVVSYCLNIAPELKYKNGIKKYLLKEVLFDYVPKSMFDRPKSGFSIPLNKWLKTDLKYLIDIYLSEKTIKNCDLVNYSIVNNIVVRYLNGEDYLYNRVWVLIQLHRFYSSL